MQLVVVRIRPKSQNSFIQTIALPAAGLPALAGRKPIFFPLSIIAEIDKRHMSMAVHKAPTDLAGLPSYRALFFRPSTRAPNRHCPLDPTRRL